MTKAGTDMGLLITFAVACLVTAAVIKHRRHNEAKPLRAYIKFDKSGPKKVPVRRKSSVPPTKDEIQTFMWDLYHQPDFIEKFQDR